MLLGSVMGAPKRPFGHAFAHLPDLEAFVSFPRCPKCGEPLPADGQTGSRRAA